MKKLLRWAAYALAALAVLLGAALIALRRAYPPERLKALAIAKLGQTLGREVRIDGVSLGLRGVDLEGLAISDAPDFRAGTFLHAGRLSARWDLAALLQRRIAISEVVLSGLDCRIVQDASGRLNVPTAAPAAAPSPARTPARPAPRGSEKHPAKAEAPAAHGASGEAFQVSVHRVRVSDGRVDFRPAGGTPLSLDHIRATVSDFRPDAEFPLSLAFDYAVGANKGALGFDGNVRLAKDGGARVRFSPLKVQRGDMALSLEGTADRDASGRLQLSAKGTVPSMSGAGLDLAGSIVPPAGRGPTRIDLSVKASRVPLESLAAFVPAVAAYRVRGNAALDVRAGGTTDAPALSGSGRLDSVSASVQGLPLTSGDVQLSFDPRQARVKTEAKLAGAALSLNAAALDYATAPDVRVEGRLAALDLSSWTGSAPAEKAGAPAPAPRATGETGSRAGASKAPGATPPAAAAAKPAPPMKTSGQIQIGPIKHPRFHADAAQASWSLSGVTPDLARLNGRAQLRVGAGKFEDLKELAAQSALAKVALLPLSILQKAAGIARLPLLPNFDKVTFKEITGDYGFQNGVMTVRESHMDSSAGYVTTTGSADLARDQLNLRIADKLAGASTPIAFFVRGTTSQPQVKADVGAILKQPGVDKAVEQGRKLLEGIFKR